MSHCFRWLRFPILALSLMALGACASLESVRLRLNANKSGIITLIAKTHGKESLFGIKGIPPDLARDIANCGLKSTRAERSDHFRIDAILKFDDQQTLKAALDCFPLDWSKPKVTLSTSDNFWSTDYTATIWFEQPLLVVGNGRLEAYYPARGGRASQFVAPLISMVPLELEVDMPTNVTGIEDLSDLHNANVSLSQQGNLATISVQFEDDRHSDPAILKTSQSLADGANVPIPTDRYKFVIKASKSKFEIGSLGIILSLLGFLFGSGVGIQGFKWLRSRRTKTAETVEEA